MQLSGFSNSVKRALFSLIFLFLLGSLQAQYAYFDANFGYHNLRFKRVDDGSLKNVALNELRFNLSTTYRIQKRFGIGFGLAIPLISGFTSNYSGAPTSSGNEFFVEDGDDNLSNLGVFAPTTYGHDLQNPLTLTIYPRIYFGDESSIFLDLRFNFMRIAEQFTFIRPAINPSNGAPLDERNIRYDETSTITGFGFKVGFENKFSEHWTFSYGLIVDSYNFDQHNGFGYLIEYMDNGNNYDRVLFGSALDGRDFSWQFGYGIAYVF